MTSVEPLRVAFGIALYTFREQNGTERFLGIEDPPPYGTVGTERFWAKINPTPHHHCSALCCVVWCCVVLCGVVWCCVVLCCVVLCCVVLCCVVLCCVVLCCVVLCCVVLCCVVLCCVVLCCVVLCCVVLCSSFFFGLYCVMLCCVMLCCIVFFSCPLLVPVFVTYHQSNFPQYERAQGAATQLRHQRTVKHHLMGIFMMMKTSLQYR